MRTNDYMVQQKTKFNGFIEKKSLISYMPHTKVGKNKCSDILHSKLTNLIIYNHI